MKKKNQKRLLLTVDRSNWALEAARYAGKIIPFHKMELVVFTVTSKVPDVYWDLDGVTALGWKMKEVRAWDREKGKRTQEYIEKATRILWRAGFPKDKVTVCLHEREKGIARDIIKEAKKGYSAVIVSRKGTSGLRSLILGSVPMKLMERLTFAPLIVVGQNPQPGSVLIAVDESEGAMKAVDHVGSLLGGSDYEFCLIHIIRGDEGSFIKRAKKEIEKVFDECKNRLLNAGLESGQITTKVITGVQSRSGAILQEAEQKGYGTIVLGRKGLSKAQEFFMGRVSTRVVQIAKRQAVWIV